jgi:hypothetical protein
MIATQAGPQELPRRIVKETERIAKQPIPGISATPKADNPRYTKIKNQNKTNKPDTSSKPIPPRNQMKPSKHANEHC